MSSTEQNHLQDEYNRVQGWIARTKNIIDHDPQKDWGHLKTYLKTAELRLSLLKEQLEALSNPAD